MRPRARAALQRDLARWRVRLDTPAGAIAAGAGIFAIGLGARLALLGLVGYEPAIEFAEMEKLARNLAETGTLGNPYFLPTGPSAHHAPVYPALLAGIFLLWGYGAPAAWAMVVMNLSFASLHYALLPALARAARLPILPAAGAAVVGAALPFRVLTESRWEVTLAALVTLVAVMLSIWWSRTVLTCGAEAPPHVRGWRAYRRAVTVGAVWGLALLTAPSLLPAFLILVLWWALAPGVTARRARLGRTAVVLLSAAVVLVPWTVRNYRTLGGLMFVRSNFGIELSVSNHDTAYVLARDNYLVGYPHNYFHEHHPWSSRVHAERVQRVGEVAYNRERLAQTMAWIGQRPGRFLQLTLGRIWQFWAMPSVNQRYKDVLLQPMTVLGLVGLVVVWRRDREVGAVFASLLAGYPLVYYLVQTGSRYRYPIDWAMLLLAAYAVAALAVRLGARRYSARSASAGSA